MTDETLSEEELETITCLKCGKIFSIGKYFLKESVKEKIQNAQRRIKEANIPVDDIIGWQKKEKLEKLDKRFNDEIDKIFLEEFGGKLTK